MADPFDTDAIALGGARTHDLGVTIVKPYTAATAPSSQTTSDSSSPPGGGQDGGGGPPPLPPPSRPAEKHPVQPKPTQAPPLNIPGSYRPGRVQPAARAHPTAALSSVMHHGGRITAPSNGASSTPRPKTQASPTGALKAQSPRQQLPTRRATASGVFHGRREPTKPLPEKKKMDAIKQKSWRSLASAAYDQPPGGELFIDPPVEPGNWQLWEAARTILEGTSAGPLDEWARRFIREHWSGPALTTGEARSAWALVTVKEIWNDPHFVSVEDSAKRLMERAWAIEADLNKPIEPARRDQLLGALSAVAYVLHILSAGNDTGYIPSQKNPWMPQP